MPKMNIFQFQNAMMARLESAKQSLYEDLLATVVDPDNNTSLHIAFLRKQGQKVDNLLSLLSQMSYFDNIKNKHGLSYLHIASARGNARLVQLFIDTGVNAREFIDKDCPVYHNYTSLQFACDSKSLETVKILVKASKLLNNHVDVNNSQTSVIFQSMIQKNFVQLDQNYNNDCKALSPFHLACIEDNPDVIDCFLNEKLVDINEPADRDSTYYPLYTPLHFAVECECKGNVQYLLENGANVAIRNGFCMTPLHLAMYRLNMGILELLYDVVKDKKSNFMDINGLTYLHIAAAMNDKKTVKKLLDYGVDINQAVLPNPRNFSNYTPLHFAVRFSHRNMVKLLHNHGANMNANEGITPLQIACEIGHTRLIQYFIRQSADATVIDPVSRKTTLHLLVQNFVESEQCLADFRKFSELSKCMRLLVKHNVDVNARDSCGNTVLHFACKDIHQSEFCAEELLDCGADINIKNNDGRTPLDIAWENSFKDDCNYESLAMFHHHVLKLKDLELEVDVNNERFCQKLIKRKTDWSRNADWILYKDIFDDEILEAKHLKRLEEIQKIKKVQIDAEVSLYDFLKFDVERASYYVRSVALKKIVEDSDFRLKYRSYAYIIRNKRKKILNEI